MSRRHARIETNITPSTRPLYLLLGWAVLGITQVVCPLLFFTDLTRNPYYTQIALLNVFICVAGLIWIWGVWERQEVDVPQIPFFWPLVYFFAIAFLSTVHSWWVHVPLRVGLTYEAIRVWLFTVINSIMVFFLPLLFTRPIYQSQNKIAIWTDVILALIWGACWLGFHSMKSADSAQHPIWDTYGGFLWILAIIYGIWRTRRGEALQFIHVIFAVSVLASIYGVMQYFGVDIIWSSLIQPYGGRPVSTFGNPNFLSTHLMLVSVLALALAVASRGSQFYGYLVVSMVNMVGVLSTLTRSTYLGLISALLVLGLCLFKKEHVRVAKWIALSVAVVIALIFIFPYSPVTRIQSPLARFTEIFTAMKTGGTYGPWHQRILIWSSAWDMVKEMPFVGKGWGSFELFFPFYQGKYLFSQTFAIWRTHANNAHNVLLEVWAQLGTIGTAFAIWLFVSIFWGGMTIFRKKMEEGLSRNLTAAALAGFVGIVVDNFFGNVSILFWWIIGAAYNESGDIVLVKRPLPTDWGKPVLLTSGFILMATSFYFVKRWNQERFYFMGFKAAKTDQVPASVKYLEQAYGWFRGEVNSNYEMGNSYARLARTLRDNNRQAEAAEIAKKAEAAYIAALHANPGYDEIYFNLGITQLQNGKRDEAIRNFETSVYINPLLKDVYAALGNQYINLAVEQNGKDQTKGVSWLNKALALFEQGVEAFPNDRDLWNNLGYTYSQLKLNEKAYEAYKRAIEIDPTFTQGFKNLYFVCQSLGRLNEPLLKVPDLIHEMEQALNRNDYANAAVSARTLTQIMPKNPHIHLSMGNILFYLGKSSESIAELKKAIEIKPDFLQAFVNLGKVYQSIGNPADAKAILNRARELDPNNTEVKTLLTQAQ